MKLFFLKNVDVDFVQRESNLDQQASTQPAELHVALKEKFRKKLNTFWCFNGVSS